MISFIIPCFNVQETIEETVVSITRETDLFCETLEVLQKISFGHSNVKVVNKTNGGVSSARNLGLHFATQEYVCFLDGDDTMDNSFFEKVTSYLYQNRDIIMYGFDKENKDLSKRSYKVYYSKNYILDYLLGKMYIHISSLLLKRSMLLRNHVVFDEDIYYSEDREFIVKCLRCSTSLAIVPNILFHYKFRSTSAMNVAKFTMKRMTSIVAMERVLNMFASNSLEAKAALLQLQLTIILVLKKYLHFGQKDKNIENVFDKYFQYLNKISLLKMNKYSMFVLLLIFVRKFSDKLFFFVLKKYK